MKKIFILCISILGFTGLLQAQTDVINITNSGGADKIGVGTGSGTPLSSFDVFGSYGQKVTTLSANITLDITHNTVVCNPTAGSFIVTLPAASGCAGRVYVIKRNAAVTANTVTVAGGATIDGAATFVLNSPNQVIEVFSDGSEWKSRVGGLSGLTTLTAGNDIDFGTSSSPNSIDIEPTLNFVHTVSAPASNNLNLNAASGFATVVNYNNGTTGTTQTFRIGNGAGADAVWVLANGETHTGWLLTEGTGTGWRNASHGGGWYMNTNTHIKTWGAKDVQIVGTGNTLRVDGLVTGNTYNAPAATTSNLLYANNTTGDIYALPTVNSATLVTSATGVPSWQASTGTGTQGYWTRSGTLLYNTNQADNVGIGTTSPQNTLHVNGGMRWGGATVAPYVYSNVDANGLYMEQVGTSTANSKIRIQSSPSGTFSGYSQFLVDPVNGFSFTSSAGGNSGFVAIGGTSPSSPLDVISTASSAFPIARISNDVNSGETGIRFRTRSSGGSNAHSDISWTATGAETGNLVFRVPYTDERMRIQSDGNVGIGATTAGARLHIGGSNQALRVDYNGTSSYFGSMRWAGLQLGNNGDNRIVAGRTATGGNLRFYVNNTNDAADYGVTPDGTQAMTILSNGNVGVNAINPSAKLEVNGNTYLKTLNQGATTTERFYPNVISSFQNTTTTGAWIIHTPIPRSSGVMFTIRVHGYGYGAHDVIDFTISGYPYGAAGYTGSIDGQLGRIINTKLSDVGTDNWKKYVGVDNAGNLAIAFGDVGNSAYFYRLSVDAWITLSSADYSSGWSIDQSTTYVSPTNQFGWRDLVGPMTSSIKGAIAINPTGGVAVTGLATSSAVYTDGSGNFTTSAPGTGSLGYWTRSGTSLYNTTLTDNVGIGTSAPGSYRLNVQQGSAISLFQSTNDAPIEIKGTDVWSGIKWTDVAGTDYIWYNGANSTFAIGGGGSNVSGKKLHVDGGVSIGANYDGNSVSSNGLAVEGNVGIGETAPAAKLEIEGTSANWNETTPGLTLGSIHLDPGSGTDHYGSAITWGASDASSGDNAQAGIYVRSDGSYGTKMYFGTTDSYATGSKTRMYIGDNGRVGIGTTSPGYQLQVYGPSANYPLMVGSPDGYVAIGPANTSWSHFSTDRPRYYFNVGASFDGGLVGSYDEDLQLQTQGTTRITASNSTGYVGIASTSPGAQLDVQGARTIKQGDLTSYVRTLPNSSVATTYNIARQFHDIYNWGYGGIQVEVYVSYYGYAQFDYGMYLCRYGYNQSANIMTKITGASAPFWTGTQVYTGVGNNYYMDLRITVPAYYTYTIKITTGMPVTTNLANTAQNYVYFY